MRLKNLEIRDLRILEDVRIEPAPTLNLFDGRNGSGKTSFLEGIHYLGTGRSFRSRRVEDVIRRGKEKLMVFGQVFEEGERAIGVGVERGRQSNRIRVGGQDIQNTSALAKQLPVLIMSPVSQRLLWEEAEHRRRMMDWAMFHVEHTYLDVFHRYKKVLRQRNAVLREGHSLEILDPWDTELTRAGETVYKYRQRYAEEVAETIQDSIMNLLDASVSVDYVPGWDVSKGLAEALAQVREKDVVRGFTSVGPHRCDLRFRISGIPARRCLSTGESKMLMIGWFLAQAEYMAKNTGAWPVLLIDDLGSELDRERASRFIFKLKETGAQVFITVVEREQVDWPSGAGCKLFHVEQGSVSEVV